MVYSFFFPLSLPMYRNHGIYCHNHELHLCESAHMSTERRRRGIFVELHVRVNQAPSGATSSEYATPDPGNLIPCYKRGSNASAGCSDRFGHIFHPS